LRRTNGDVYSWHGCARSASSSSTVHWCSKSTGQYMTCSFCRQAAEISSDIKPAPHDPSLSLGNIQRRALQIIVGNVSYEVACDMLNLSTLAKRRLSICSTLFRQQITRESHVFHYLLLVKRDAEVAGRLRSTKKYPTVRTRTSRYKNSFIPYALFNFQ